jgi:hypothetical protein
MSRPAFYFLRPLKPVTTGCYQPQLNLDEPPEGPQEEDDSDPLEDEKPERIFSGFSAPQAGQVKNSPPSLIFWNRSKITLHLRHRYS